MAVKAKVRCIANKAPHWEQPESQEPSRVIRFTPVYDDSEANREWSKWTPSGYFEMSVTNTAAFEQFEEGADYLVTFEKA